MASEREESLQFSRRVMDAAIHLGLLAVLVVGCYAIIGPFLMPVIWGVVLAIALSPFYEKLAGLMGGRRKIAAALFVLVGLAVLLVPTWFLLSSAIEGLVKVGRELDTGTITVPPVPEGVEKWPVVGEKLAAAWTEALDDPPGFFSEFSPQLKAIGGAILSGAGGLVFGALGFALSVILAGVFLATAQGGLKASEAVGVRLLGEKGRGLIHLIGKTVMSVAKGVVGVAFIQSLAAGAGMLVAGVPMAGLWALIVLIMAVVQLPIIVIMVPAAIYVFSTTGTTGAVIFAIYALAVSVSDSFLKPIFFGGSVETPMLVLLIGAIGGMLAFGILGLFVGAVVLAVGYQLFVAWVKEGDESAAEASPAAEEQP